MNTILAQDFFIVPRLLLSGWICQNHIASPSPFPRQRRAEGAEVRPACGVGGRLWRRCWGICRLWPVAYAITVSPTQRAVIIFIWIWVLTVTGDGACIISTKTNKGRLGVFMQALVWSSLGGSAI
ncbi:hypothetical protein ACOMHN_012816 [Nucella lapillus]